MIRASLEGKKIVVIADSEGAPIAAKLPGITRTAKMPPLTWHLPLNCNSIELLRGVKARACPELITEARRLMAVHRYVEAQKNADHVEPIRPVPIKPDVQLYTHQIKGYNIVLALFGYVYGTWR